MLTKYKENTNLVPESEHLSFCLCYNINHKIVWHATKETLLQDQERWLSESVLKVREVILEELALNYKYRPAGGIR